MCSVFDQIGNDGWLRLRQLGCEKGATIGFRALNERP